MDKTKKKVTSGSKTNSKAGRPKSENPRYMDLETINKNKAALKAKINKMLENGRVEIQTRQQLENFPLGSLVSYLTKEGLYRSGGFLKTIQDDYFVLLGGTKDDRISFSVQFKNIKSMYVGNPMKTKSDNVSIVPTTKPKTKFPVTIGKVVVYYAKDKFDYNRFLETAKYKRYMDWYEKFGKKKKKVTKD